VDTLSRLTYSRAMYGFAEGDDGSNLDVHMQHSDVANGLFIEADLVLFYELDDAGKEIVADTRTEVAGRIFGTLDQVFSDLFG
jgi:hypothetical protein